MKEIVSRPDVTKEPFYKAITDNRKVAQRNYPKIELGKELAPISSTVRWPRCLITYTYNDGMKKVCGIKQPCHALHTRVHVSNI